MKKPEFKDMTAEELRVKGRDLRQELFNLRLQQATSQLEKPSRMRTIRKDIARIETQLSVLRNTRKAA
jgi:large subunit ribosomal protein L29